MSDSRVIAGVVRSAHDSQTAEGDEEQRAHRVERYA